MGVWETVHHPVVSRKVAGPWHGSQWIVYYPLCSYFANMSVGIAEQPVPILQDWAPFVPGQLRCTGSNVCW